MERKVKSSPKTTPDKIDIIVCNKPIKFLVDDNIQNTVKFTLFTQIRPQTYAQNPTFASYNLFIEKRKSFCSYISILSAEEVYIYG